jgi:hypothetical protein
MRRYALDFDQNYWEFREEFKQPKPDARNEQGKGKKGKDKAENANNSSQQPQQSTQPQQHQQQKQQSSGRPNQQNRGGRRHQSGNNQNNAGQQNKTGADNQQQSQPRGPLTQQEKDERRAKGLCLYCGKAGHSYRDCSLLPSNRKPVVGRATYSFTPADTAPTDDRAAAARPKSKNVSATVRDAEVESDSAGNSSPA